MDFIEREKLIALFKDIETNYPQESWNLKRINFWPIVKTSVFFYLENESFKKKKESVSFIRRIINLGKVFKLDVIYSLIYLLRSKFKKIDYLFAGASSYRISWNNLLFNRYFDPMMDDLNGESLLFEYTKKVKKKYYKKERIIDATQFIHYFRYTSKRIKLNEESFIYFQVLFKEIQQIVNVDCFNLLARIEDDINETFAWTNLWKYVLKRTKPRYAFLLCYYDFRMFGLILASKKQNVKSVDMQHGGQGDFHPAYSYANLPKIGYDFLPDIFWNWDESSNENIKKFIINSPHECLVGDNPWINYLKNQNFDLGQENKEIILVTLQTGKYAVLQSYILDGIKKSTDDFQWWIRLHPRTTETERIELEKSLTISEVKDRVEILKASLFPLPAILSQCVAHLSHFSGSIIEANLVGVSLNIVIGEVGKVFYEDLILGKEVKYFDPDGPLNLFDYIQLYLAPNHIHIENNQIKSSYQYQIESFRSEK